MGDSFDVIMAAYPSIELPIPDRNFGGTMGRTIDKSVADWSMIPGSEAPEDASW